MNNLGCSRNKSCLIFGSKRTSVLVAPNSWIYKLSSNKITQSRDGGKPKYSFADASRWRRRRWRRHSPVLLRACRRCRWTRPGSRRGASTTRPSRTSAFPWRRKWREAAAERSLVAWAELTDQNPIVFLKYRQGLRTEGHWFKIGQLCTLVQ